MFGGLLPLIVIGIVIYAVVAAVRRRQEPDVVADRGGSASVRRLFQYAITFSAFVVAASGVSGLLGYILSGAAARSDTELAGSLAMTIVAVPVYVALASWVRRTHAADTTERNGLGWSLYLNGALITSLGVAIGSAFAFIADAIDGDWHAGAFAALVVWSVGWGAHWIAWRRLAPGALARFHLWVGSVAGLGVTAVAAGFVLTALGERALHAVAETAAVVRTGDDLRLAVAGVLIGAAVWGWHWLANGLRAEHSEGWYVTVLLFGVLGGLATAVVAGGYGLYLTLEWFFGDPETTSAVRHFQDLIGPVAAALVGLAVWRYHRAVVGPTVARDRADVDRVYDYVVAGVGLATMAVATVILVVAFFRVLTPASAAGGDDSSANTLLAAVTLLVVGGPVWATAWRRAQRMAATDDHAEVRSPIRKMYLFAIFGVGAAVAFGALINLLIVVFEAILEEGSGRRLAEDLEIPVALLLTTGAGAIYHWLVYRAERQLAVPRVFRDVLLVANGAAIGTAVAEQAHARVRTLHRLDLAEDATYDIEAIVAAIDRTEGEHLLVLAGEDEVQVVPYR